MSEREYYTNLPYTNYCKQKGYEERQEDEARVQRMASFRIHQSIVEKPVTLTEYWPLPSDKKVVRETLLMTKEMWNEIRKAHKLK